MDSLAYKKLGITLELMSFFLVAPEFLGPSRLRSLGDNAKTLLTAPLQKLEEIKAKLRKNVEVGQFSAGIGCAFSAFLLLMGVALVCALGLSRFHVGMNRFSFTLLWLIAVFGALLAGLTAVGILALLSMPFAYVGVSLIVRLCSGTLHALASAVAQQVRPHFPVNG